MKSLADFLQDISNLEIITLAYDDPRIKVKMIQAIVFRCLDSKQQVHYIDLDLQFSSMLQNLSTAVQEKIHNFDLHVLQPPNEIGESVALFESNCKGGLIVIDTLNTVQNLFLLQPSITDSKTANHRSAVMVSTIQQTARFYSKPVIVLNLTKSRPKKTEDSVAWERDIVGGRMTHFKSDVIMFAKEEPKVKNGNTRISIVVDTVSSDQFGGKVNDAYEILID